MTLKHRLPFGLRSTVKRTKFFHAILGTLVIYVLTQLFWLGLLFFLVFMLCTTVWGQLQKVKRNLMRRALKALFFLLFVIAISNAIKIFICDVYLVPSISMEDTLLPGDIILVNKLEYGPSLPQSPFEISWVNLLFYITHNNKADIERNWWPYRRLPGWGTIEKGDILVYRPRRAYFEVKRCMATPGDTLSLIDGEVFVDGTRHNFAKSVKESYTVFVDNLYRFYKEAHGKDVKFKLFPIPRQRESLRGNLSQNDIKELKSFITVKGLSKQLDSFSSKNRLFANPEGAVWTLDNMGPVVIPKKDMTIELDDYNFTVYKKYSSKLKGLKSNAFKDQKPHGRALDYVTFEKDCFFLMGDNRKNSVDSRYAGFIPKEKVVGRAQVVLFSQSEGQVRWDRIFKRLD